MSIKFDSVSEKWFKEHRFAETTLMRCKDCGLYYKPSLGHRCKKKKVIANDP